MRLLALLATALGLVIVSGTAGAGNSYPSAVGAAERSADIFAARHIALSAHDGPTGTTGEFTSTNVLGQGLQFTADVACLFVDGNRAVIGGVIRQTASAAVVGETIFVAVEDNGDPSNGATPDRVSAYVFEPPPASDTCASATFLYPTLAPVTSGNIVVLSGL